MSVATATPSLPDGVTAEAWAAIGATRNGSGWHIPERDAFGTVIGTSVRGDNGKKWSVTGSRRGLTMAWPRKGNTGTTDTDPIIIVEGATDTAVANSLGFCGVGRPSANGGIELLQVLVKNLHVAIITENDKSGVGRTSAREIAGKLHAVAASVKIIDPPDGAKDLREWATAPSPLTREELCAIIRRTPPLMLQRDNTVVLQSESFIVAAMLLRPDCAARLRNAIHVDLIRDPLRRALLAEALRQCDAHGAVNVATVSERVSDNLPDGVTAHELAVEVGELWKVAEIVSEPRLAIAICESQERVNSGQLHLKMSTLREKLDGGATVAEVYAEIEEMKAKHAHSATAKCETLADLLAVPTSDDAREVIRTGFPWVDCRLPYGGFGIGETVGISGAPGRGKSAFALQLTLGVARTNPDIHCLWCAGEMRLQSIRMRAMQFITGLPRNYLALPDDDSPAEVLTAKADAMQELQPIAKRLHFCTGPLSVSKIESAVLATGAKWVVVDYLQLVEPTREGNSRREELDNTIRALMTVAQTHGVALVFVSELSANPGSGGRTIYNAFKESTGIGYACDLAFVGESLEGDEIEKPSDAPTSGTQPIFMRWRCLKARHGPPLEIVCQFDPSIQRFRGVRD